KDSAYVTWLLEERRPTGTKRWSGTNDHPSHHSNRLGSTLNAFAHFAFLYSHKTLSLRTCKVSCPFKGAGKVVNILFDIMTHTINEDSGVGDHGEEGIAQFVAQHECVERCKELGLESL
ncbi:kinase-like domain-containing protein, partial [Mycena floridula]